MKAKIIFPFVLSVLFCTTFSFGQTPTQELSNTPKTELNVALMLPLYLSEVHQIRTSSRDRLPRPFSFVTFYEGTVLAAQAFAGRGAKVNVQVFDVTEDESMAVRLINSGRLDDVDIIVGPFFLRAFGVMSEYAKERNIFIINPMSPRDDILDDNPYVIKVNTSERNQLKALINQAIWGGGQQQIFVLSNDSLLNEKGRSEYAKWLFETHYSHLKTPVFVDISKDRFRRFITMLSDTERNTIIYLSNNEAFATEILTQVSRRENTSNVLYSWRRLSQFEFADPRHLNDMQTHYVDPFFVDRTCEKVRGFERLFFETYRTIPDNHAYLGYDVMTFVLEMLDAGNTDYGTLLETANFRGLQNPIHLGRASPSQGLENQKTNIIKIEASRARRVSD